LENHGPQSDPNLLQNSPKMCQKNASKQLILNHFFNFL